MSQRMSTSSIKTYIDDASDLYKPHNGSPLTLAEYQRVLVGIFNQKDTMKGRKSDNDRNNGLACMCVAWELLSVID